MKDIFDLAEEDKLKKKLKNIGILKFEFVEKTQFLYE